MSTNDDLLQDVLNTMNAEKDDPNRSLSADEIAALFSQAGRESDAPIGLASSNDGGDGGKFAAEAEIAGNVDSSIANEADQESSMGEQNEAMALEEIEIDLDDPAALDLLLGIREVPHREVPIFEEDAPLDEKGGANVTDETDSTLAVEEQADEKNEPDEMNETNEADAADELHATKADIQEEIGRFDDSDDLENIIDAMAEDDENLKEIGELLKKSDNHELVEEDILSLLDEGDQIDENGNRLYPASEKEGGPYESGEENMESDTFSDEEGFVEAGKHVASSEVVSRNHSEDNMQDKKEDKKETSLSAEAVPLLSEAITAEKSKGKTKRAFGRKKGKGEREDAEKQNASLRKESEEKGKGFFARFRKKKNADSDLASVSVEQGGDNTNAQDEELSVLPAMGNETMQKQRSEDSQRNADTKALQNSNEGQANSIGEVENAREDELSAIPQKTKNKKKSQGKDKNKKELENGKKDNVLTRFFRFLTEEEEEDEEETEESAKAETKKEKKKRGKGAKVTDADDNEGILEELDAEAKKKKKVNIKKADKPKKKKKEEPAQQEEKQKKLPKKMIIRIFVLCFSILILLLLVSHFLPEIVSMRNAKDAFYKQEYETAYREMYGKKLSEQDDRIFQKAKLITQLQHKFDSYLHFKKMNLKVEALDALLSGLAFWHTKTPEINTYNAVNETNVVKEQIVNELEVEYHISEKEAEEINALSDYDYTKRLEEITGSLSMKNSNWVNPEEAVIRLTDDTIAEDASPEKEAINEEKKDLLLEEERE